MLRIQAGMLKVLPGCMAAISGHPVPLWHNCWAALHAHVPDTPPPMVVALQGCALHVLLKRLRSLHYIMPPWDLRMLRESRPLAFHNVIRHKAHQSERHQPPNKKPGRGCELQIRRGSPPSRRASKVLPIAGLNPFAGSTSLAGLHEGAWPSSGKAVLLHCVTLQRRKDQQHHSITVSRFGWMPLHVLYPGLPKDADFRQAAQ